MDSLRQEDVNSKQIEDSAEKIQAEDAVKAVKEAVKEPVVEAVKESVVEPVVESVVESVVEPVMAEPVVVEPVVVGVAMMRVVRDFGLLHDTFNQEFDEEKGELEWPYDSENDEEDYSDYSY
jgi:hypothetical protein